MGRAAGAAEEESKMFVLHICSLIFILYPVYGDVRTQEIRLFPGLCLIAAGVLARTAAGEISGAAWLLGGLPGVLSFLIGRLFGGCIGGGDSFLIGGIGLLEGINFCWRMLTVSGVLVFVFSMGMMAVGKLRRKSKVPGTPFLALGYLGAWLL